METVFNSENTYFLTFRGVSPAHQKIDFVRKLCSKISNNYFIVREKNKRNDQYHFHAILVMITKPKPSWFKKGCHFNLQKVGNGNITYTTCPTVLPHIPIVVTAQEMEGADPADLKEWTDDKEDKIINKVIRTATNRKGLVKHVYNVLKYMRKDFEMPIQFHDYIYVVKSKSTILMKTNVLDDPI